MIAKETGKQPAGRAGRRVLVTGGGGFLGNAIVRQLVARGDTVRSFSRGYYPGLADLNVEQIQGDIGDRQAVSDACEHVDLVFHTAAKPPFWGPYEAYYQANVVGTQNVIAGCRKQTVPCLVHTSSPSVIHGGKGSVEGIDESAPYPETFPTPYHATKALAEQKVVAASRNGLRAIILRPHLIWGPGDPHFTPRILARAGKLLRVGDGKNLVDTVYIDNAADAHLLAADALAASDDLAGKIYFISQDEPVCLWDMIDAILKAGGKPPVTRSISSKTAYAIGAALEFVYRLFRITSEPPMARFVAHELSSAHWFDISAAKQDLGYAPRVSIEQGLAELEKWLNRGKIQERETI
ncbi:MAG: NAD-dependent epimerase/dehydratase family protein [Desulfobacteraceae bacterium]|jgi:nucleoside-diphosphate-sugar epimerase|nr:NAD-dependent epimerase/dehydratase family protein [Desulfobacteraceae bacterium]